MSASTAISQLQPLPLPHPSLSIPHPHPHPHPQSPASSSRNRTTARYEHPTSSLRGAVPNDTDSPAHSRSASPEEEDELDEEIHEDGLAAEEDDFLAHQKGSGKRTKAKGQDPSPSSRAEKRRRTRSSINTSSTATKTHTPTQSHVHSRSSPSDSSILLPPPSRRKHSNQLPPINLGFAASRENRREVGNDSGLGGEGGPYEHSLPSPVVMGFDYKAIDEQQLKTVRDTISIREQQQALIAARRRESAASQPSTPKELTFKGWQPKDSNTDIKPALNSGGVGRRRDKTREKVEKMSISTASKDKDMVPGSKSAPLNQGLSAQQASTGPQTSVPHMLPPLGQNGPLTSLDPRTAPIPHARARTGEDNEFARQQFFRPSGTRYDPASGSQTARPASLANQRNFTAPTISTARPPNSSRYDVRVDRERDPRAVPQNGQAHSHDHPGHGYTNSASPPQPHPATISGPSTGNSNPASFPSSRRDFLAPFDRFYDLLAQGDQLRYGLQDLLHRYEGALATKMGEVSDFKSTANRANALIINLQQSADNIQEMVRYEISRAGGGGGGGGLSGGEKMELEDLRERVKRLEDAVLGRGGVAGEGNKDVDGSSEPGREKEREKERSGSVRGKKVKGNGKDMDVDQEE